MFSGPGMISTFPAYNCFRQVCDEEADLLYYNSPHVTLYEHVAVRPCISEFFFKVLLSEKKRLVVYKLEIFKVTVESDVTKNTPDHSLKQLQKLPC